MELKKLTEHIWYMPFEEERDRPNLGYIRGEKSSASGSDGADALALGSHFRHARDTWSFYL